jgi:hypothetical protein
MEGGSNSGIPPQTASNTSKAMEGGELKPVDSKKGRLHLGKINLSGSARSKPKR